MVTTAQLLDIGEGVGQRADTFRFDVLNSTLDIQGQIELRSDVTPTVTNNIHAQIKRTASIAPKPSEIDSLNLLIARVRPVMILPDDTEYNLGVFMFADSSAIRWTYGTVPSPILVDQGLVVDQPIPNAYGAATGSSVKTLIEALLSEAGITSFQIDVDATIGSPMAWPPGVSRQTVINELAATAGGYSLFFDNDGMARVIEAPSADVASLHYRTTSPRISMGSIVESDDTLDAPNRFIVISQTGDSDGGVAVGVYDIADSAPHSAVNRGYVVARVLTTTGLTSSAAAAARAESWAKQSASNFSWLSFSSPLDPRHDTFDVVDVDVGDGAGPVVYREQGWSMALVSGGLMMHDCRRSYQ